MAEEHIDGQENLPDPGSDTACAARDPAPGRPPPRERRSRHRVADDQKSGHGAMSALSRLQMIARRRAALAPDNGGHPGSA
jgi:hypothetical protein